MKVVQKTLGQASATMTVDTYGHLFENRLDEVAEAMDAARTAQRAQRDEADSAANALSAVANLLPISSDPETAKAS